MASREEIEVLLDRLEKAPPSAHFQHIDRNTAGINAILKFLSESDGRVTAGKISEHMKVSTARVAVLLKKMEEKNLIVRQQDPDDGRIVIVKLSESGREAAEDARDEIYRSLGEMIDKVGMERMLEFAAISAEIHSLMKEPDIEV